MSSDLQWMIVRNSSSFLMKRRHAPTFSKERNNLKGLNSYRFNGLIRKKTIGVEPLPDGKGVAIITKNASAHRKLPRQYTKVELKRGARRTLKSIKSIVRNGKYRKDLKSAALRRASAILKSQKPVVPKKIRGEKKKE
ncbi:hypothetical protein HELRODRAFT_165615 [Helobdella robusta]|uniref:Large ribosomal subunit protein eL28 n=1 Tax=Helobdella robusta TaxID=6412 RepID=T1EX31_HELRO|nr:hypothetical protein HELRODRAFT_165615 [Helobdella robusta]ESN91563.1 hypothetical protein HELRODRAFT_165615 [Helobdella robusta]